jgi:hypothetical protein
MRIKETNQLSSVCGVEQKGKPKRQEWIPRRKNLLTLTQLKKKKRVFCNKLLYCAWKIWWVRSNCGIIYMEATYFDSGRHV